MQFVVLTPRFQIISVFVGLSVLSWVAYASVMTGFKDQIVAAKEERVQSLQNRYEAQIARMRLDYDDLSTKLALAEERFQTTVAAIEKRQSDLQTAMVDQESAGDALHEVVERASTVRALGLGPDASHIENEEDPSAAGGIEESEAKPAPVAPAPDATPAPVVTGTRLPAVGITPAPRAEAIEAPEGTPVPTAKPETLRVASAADAGADPSTTQAALEGTPSDFIASGRNMAAGKTFAALEGRLEAVEDDQHDAAAELFEAALMKEKSLREVIAIAGMDPNAIAPLPDAQGGPLIPETPANADPMARDPNLAAADTTLVRLATLQTAMLSIPFANPLPSVTRISSGFGGRSDPFTGGRAFHSGLDFKANFGADVRATAPGVVVSADWHGGYGRMVEIDHGYGLKTRYAHLSAINVVEGQKVAFGEKVGELGSTGRSTGPHLHYEVWYDGQARNPWNYLKAGADVLERQGS